MPTPLSQAFYRLEQRFAALAKPADKDEWRKDRRLALHQAFLEVIRGLQQQTVEIATQLETREQLLALWDESKIRHADVKEMLAREHDAFYRQLWAELQESWKQAEEPELYFRISIPAMQLLFLIQLLHEGKIMEAPLQGNLFHFISRHIGTMTQEKLSYESLRKKYRRADRQTMVKVRRLLLDLVQEINERIL